MVWQSVIRAHIWACLVAIVQRSEELGYDPVWSAEAYGFDVITPLAFLAAKTNRIPRARR